MGMYTGINLKVKLNYDKMSADEGSALDYMFSGLMPKFANFPLPNHPFFESNYFRCDGGLSGFEPFFSRYQDESDRGIRQIYTIHIAFNTKNFDWIEHFLNWISPFVIDFEGKYKYEEWSGSVPLIKENGVITQDYSLSKCED